MTAGDVGRAGCHPGISEGISPKVTNELDAVSLAGKFVTRQETALFGLGRGMGWAFELVKLGGQTETIGA